MWSRSSKWLFLWPWHTLLSSIPFRQWRVTFQQRDGCSHDNLLRTSDVFPEPPPSSPFITDVGIYARHVAFTDSHRFRDTCMQKDVVHSTFTLDCVDFQHQTLFVSPVCPSKVHSQVDVGGQLKFPVGFCQILTKSLGKKEPTRGFYPATKWLFFARQSNWFSQVLFLPIIQTRPQLTTIEQVFP